MALSNVSVSAEKIKLIDIYQRSHLEPELRRRLISKLLLAPNEANSVPSRLMPLKLQLQVIQENSADYEYIAREYLGRSDGKLFYEPLPDASLPWTPPRSERDGSG